MKYKPSTQIKAGLLAILPYAIFWIWFILVGLKNPYAWSEGGLFVVFFTLPASLFVVNFDIFSYLPTYLMFAILGFAQYFAFGYFIGWIINKTKK